MKEKKVLSQGKAIASIIIIYTILTIIFGAMYSLLGPLLSRIIRNMVILSTISVVLSIVIIYFSWKLSIMITFRNGSSSGLKAKKITKYLALFLIVISVISMAYDVYRSTVVIEEEYSNAFLEDKDVVAAFTQEELQARANENNAGKAIAQKQTYISIVVMGSLALIINLLILSMVSKKTIEKYNGVIEIEKRMQN